MNLPLQMGAVLRRVQFATKLGAPSGAGSVLPATGVPAFAGCPPLYHGCLCPGEASSYVCCPDTYDCNCNDGTPGCAPPS
jgi:hypothetical protein